MENTILTIIKVITALYFNDKAEDTNPEIYKEMQSIISNIKIEPRAVMGLGGEDSIIEALRYTAEWMIYNSSGNYSKQDLMQRLTINFQGNSEYLEVAKSSLIDDISQDDARSRVIAIMQELRYDKKRSKLKQVVSKANAVINYGSTSVAIGGYITDLVSELSELHTADGDEITGLVSRVNFSNKGDIAKTMKKSKSLVSLDGALNTGFQGMNDACGGLGIPRGFLVNFGACSHHYKSGILVDLALNIPAYNTPWMWDPNKKPMIMFITFENSAEQNIMIIYKKYYEIKYGKECNESEIDVEVAEQELGEYFEQNGYHFCIEHYSPADFSVYDLLAVMNRAITAGYELHAVICDYLYLIAHNSGGDSLNIQVLKTFEMVRTYCMPKGITFITAHQLSTEAQRLIKTDIVSTANFTRKVNTGGWYQECQALHQKFDLEFVMHIHLHIDGYKYLTFSRGKHRGGEKTPQCKLHFMYKFQAFGGIVPDVNKESQVLYALPKQMSDGMDRAWED